MEGWDLKLPMTMFHAIFELCNVEYTFIELNI